MPDIVERLRARLISWAQNEEMVNVGFTEHGIDCIAAAEVMEKQSAEIERLQKVAVAKDDAMKIQAKEIERLREIVEQAPFDFPTYRAATDAEIERLRKDFTDLLRLAANDASKYQAEIERLRGEVTKYKARLQVVRDSLHREGFEKELSEWYDFDGIPK